MPRAYILQLYKYIYIYTYLPIVESQSLPKKVQGVTILDILDQSLAPDERPVLKEITKGRRRGSVSLCLENVEMEYVNSQAVGEMVRTWVQMNVRPKYMPNEIEMNLNEQHIEQYWTPGTVVRTKRNSCFISQDLDMLKQLPVVTKKAPATATVPSYDPRSIPPSVFSNELNLNFQSWNNERCLPQKPNPRTELCKMSLTLAESWTGLKNGQPIPEVYHGILPWYINCQIIFIYYIDIFPNKWLRSRPRNKEEPCNDRWWGDISRHLKQGQLPIAFQRSFRYSVFPLSISSFLWIYK